MQYVSPFEENVALLEMFVTCGNSQSLKLQVARGNVDWLTMLLTLLIQGRTYGPYLSLSLSVQYNKRRE